ncbi:MAG: hypothetical protein B6I24_08525 [Bacteroidetes bacterium 4572_128]|nr:MAG: hypothetical protein B6I24_08525 [Bacteroidetes bacterium 4572_128]
MYRRDETIIFLMLQTIEKIFEYSSIFKNPEEFVKDGKSFDAVMMNFIALGETVSKLSDDFKNKNSNIVCIKLWHLET